MFYFGSFLNFLPGNRIIDRQHNKKLDQAGGIADNIPIDVRQHPFLIQIIDLEGNLIGRQKMPNVLKMNNLIFNQLL